MIPGMQSGKSTRGNMSGFSRRRFVWLSFAVAAVWSMSFAFRVAHTGVGSQLTVALENLRLLGVQSIDRPVLWLQPETDDYFAGAWLQSTEKFLKLNLSTITNLEGATFIAFSDSKSNRYAVDWMDFSVEHMSTWWKGSSAIERNDDTAIRVIVGGFDKYINATAGYIRSTYDSLRPTIAVVPFRALESSQHPDRADQLSLVSLGATIASMLRAGVGRVVVVGLTEVDRGCVDQVFRRLREESKKSELSFVVAEPTWYHSVYEPLNIPKGALVGTQYAFLGSLSPTETERWLGKNPSQWKYIYFTEPDLIWQTRPHVLPELRRGLDRGLVFAPHRLQPIPHETDLKGYDLRTGYVPAVGELSRVVSIDGRVDSCCDNGNQHPGKPPNYLHCGTWWYSCGIGSEESIGANISNTTVAEWLHRRLLHYGFMRLSQGTGIVMVAGSEHARQCLPVTDGRGCLAPRGASPVPMDEQGEHQG